MPKSLLLCLSVGLCLFSNAISDSSLCLPGWQYFNGTKSCYIAQTSPLTWSNAEESCLQLGNGQAHLASIHSASEDAFVESLMEVAQWDLGQSFWIGLSKLDPVRHIYWTDDTSVDFLYWSLNQPDNSNYGGIESCVEVFTKNNYNATYLIPGKWNDNRCDTQDSYVCKMPCQTCSSPDVTIEPPSGPMNCKPGWQLFRQRCYKFFGANLPGDIPSLNFDAAFHFCRLQNLTANDRANLVAIRDIYDQRYLESMAAMYTQDVWIGLWVQSYEENLIWYDDDTPYTFNNFDPDSPFEDSGCAKMHTDKAKLGLWETLPLQDGQDGDEASDCKDPLGFICMEYADPTLPTQAPTPSADGCPPGFIDYPGYGCYSFQTTAMDFNTANNFCQNFTSAAFPDIQLVSIIDPYELAFVISRAADKMFSSFWIGLSRRNGTATFRWVNHWPLATTMWAVNEPTTDNSKNCVHMTTNNTRRGGDWYTEDCNAKYPFICKASFDQYMPPTRSPTYCNNTNLGWFDGDDACYLLIPKLASFLDGQYLCQDEYNGKLASFRHLREIRILMETPDLWKVIDQFYIGLQANKQSGYSWLDGSPLSFANWAPGQPPSNVNTSLMCTWMDSDGLWYAEDCFLLTPRMSLCMQPLLQSPVSISSTLRPTTTVAKNPGGPTTGSPHSGGLSPGAQAGIAIVVILFVGVLVVLGFLAYRKYPELHLQFMKQQGAQKKMRHPHHDTTPIETNNIGNPNYVNMDDATND